MGILLLFGFKESWSILKIKHWSCSKAPKWSFQAWICQPYLVINIAGLVQFGKNLSHILPPLASYNYLQRSISVKLIYQFLYLINGYLLFKCLEQVFEEERNQNKKGNSQVPGLRSATLFKKKTLAQVLSCEFCETLKSLCPLPSFPFHPFYDILDSSPHPWGLMQVPPALPTNQPFLVWTNISKG